MCVLYLLIIQTSIYLSENLKREKIMKKIVGFVGLMVLGLSNAMADCSAGTQVKNNLSAFLEGKVVDGTATSDGEKWNEIHCINGDLWKQGGAHSSPSDYIEAPSKVGTWVVSGSGATSEVTYTYTRGTTSSSFSFTLHENKDNSGNIVNYSFCDGNAEVVNATFLGNASCTP